MLKSFRVFGRPSVHLSPQGQNLETPEVVRWVVVPIGTQVVLFWGSGDWTQFAGAMNKGKSHKHRAKAAQPNQKRYNISLFSLLRVLAS